MTLIENRTIDPSEYFFRGDPSHAQEQYWISTDVYYQARTQAVHGVLTLKQDHISFTSKDCPDANLMIDYLDIVAATKL